VKQPDKTLKARGLTVYISDIRNCTTREQEEQRVFEEMANIRAKFSQKTKPLSSYDRRKYVWKLVYTHLLGYDVDFGHMQAIELLAGASYAESCAGTWR
jgi:AP-2 complex subunit alpha